MPAWSAPAPPTGRCCARPRERFRCWSSFGSARGGRQPLVLASAPETRASASPRPERRSRIQLGHRSRFAAAGSRGPERLVHRPPRLDHDALADSVVEHRTVYHFYARTPGRWWRCRNSRGSSWRGRTGQRAWAGGFIANARLRSNPHAGSRSRQRRSHARWPRPQRRPFHHPPRRPGRNCVERGFGQGSGPGQGRNRRRDPGLRPAGGRAGVEYCPLGRSARRFAGGGSRRHRQPAVLVGPGGHCAGRSAHPLGRRPGGGGGRGGVDEPAALWRPQAQPQSVAGRALSGIAADHGPDRRAGRPPLRHLPRGPGRLCAGQPPESRGRAGRGTL